MVDQVIVIAFIYLIWVKYYMYMYVFNLACVWL